MTTASRPLRSSTNGSEFAEKLSELRTLITDLARCAPSAASETFDELKNKAASICDGAESGVAKATQTVVKTVKKHPAEVVLAAVGAGLLAWWLLSHRGKSE